VEKGGKYAVNVTLYKNEFFDTREQADQAAEAWLDRLAERDAYNTWDECDWQTVEVFE
tara:strand:- start:634 stop:807 length:174 start_codon:yes stop_codon:yes gene_type:complete